MMKHGLKRIEATLSQLAVQSLPAANSPAVTTKPGNASGHPGQSRFFTLSQSVNSPPVKEQEPLAEPVLLSAGTSPSFTLNRPAVTTCPVPEAPLLPALGSTVTSDTALAVQPFPVSQDDLKAPNLPKFKSPSLSSHRHGPNPGLAMGLLQEMQTKVAGWQQELNHIVQQIQDIYQEGPIVDGWLESHDREPEAGVPSLRHAEVDRLLDYVEEICGNSQDSVTCQSPRTGYRLCGLNADGQLWSRPCPPEQLPGVSLAIARYQKLRHLLGRKQVLETRLGQLAETLIVVHSHLQETNSSESK